MSTIEQHSGSRNITRELCRQRGIALPLFVIGLLAIFAMAGLALDTSHAFINKTRLQNTADAAALTAAKVYDQTADTLLSTAAANSVFGINTDGNGNFEVDAAYDAGDIAVIVQYSQTLNPVHTWQWHWLFLK